MSTPNTLVVGTRKSNLALIQTHMVADALASANEGTAFPVVDMTTAGDRNQTTPLHLLSPYNSTTPAKSLWTDELESALLDGRMDLLVHSCKDVPTTIRQGCEIGALLERHDPRDAFVVKAGLHYKTIDELPAGAVVGTGSVRRVAQLSRAYPHLKFADMVSRRRHARGEEGVCVGKILACLPAQPMPEVAFRKPPTNTGGAEVAQCDLIPPCQPTHLSYHHDLLS